jgi:hypothetical protein
MAKTMPLPSGWDMAIEAASVPMALVKFTRGM